MNLKASLLSAALALVALASPGVAAAAHHHAHHAVDSYPMKADEFRQLMEKRIDGVRGIIDRKLVRRGVSAERKKEIHKIFDDASKDLRAEIDHAAADGTVTQAEANKVKTLATGLRAKVRERLRAEKDPKLKEKLAAAEATKKDHAAKEAARKKAEAASAATASATSPQSAKAGGAKPASDAAKKKTKPAKARVAGPSAGPTRTAKAPASKKPKPAKLDPPESDSEERM
jgi:hypothetical protein